MGYGRRVSQRKIVEKLHALKNRHNYYTGKVKAIEQKYNELKQRINLESKGYTFSSDLNF